MAKAKPKAKATDPTDAFLAEHGNDDLLATKADTAKMDANNLERHPLSEKYGPPVSEEELLGLATDIEQNGQHDTIKLYEGKVLAGWNRYRACRMKGIEPRVENYTGDKPESVAFSTNVLRRRMSSVAKAFMGALYYTSVTGEKQIDVAKKCGVSLNRLNQCCQLLKLDTDEAKRVREVLQTNPEVTGTNFDEMLLECGITRSNPKVPSNVRPIRDGVPLDIDEVDPDELDLDLEDDLTGGAIDNLVGGDDLEDEDGDTPKPRARKEIGEGAAPLPSVGGKGPSMTRPDETMVSKMAKAFKKLSPAERVDFVVFTWGNMQTALQGAILGGKVNFEIDLGDGGEPIKLSAKPAKAKGAAYVAEQKAKKPAKPAAKAAPAEPAGDAKPPAKGKATPAAKKAPTGPAKGKAKPKTEA